MAALRRCRARALTSWLWCGLFAPKAAYIKLVPDVLPQ
jgi:hypothetical protein